MMDREILVYVDLDGVSHLVGRLWAHTRKNKESATFQYDDSWLANPAKFSPEPCDAQEFCPQGLSLRNNAPKAHPSFLEIIVG
jgi:hypothetical protein